MKVAHREDYDTHAVIGGAEIKEFGIAQTAEFFTVLSNTLYTDKPLAVVREVLCNAWDAHIVSGRKDVPVKVTLDEEKLVIRDFGPGIHPNNMHTIYCVYGASTKENDGNQTGGFGLGSKAPFAYSDHFTVVTYHAGYKTVYAISRGSAKTQGKPDIRIMVQVPSTETGLEVVIPMKNSYDQKIFREHIEKVASYGEMNVKLNDEHIAVVPISMAEDNIFVTTQDFTSSYNRIFVRYGNVVYPIPSSPDYVVKLNKLETLIQRLHTGRSGLIYRMILQAAPNSISVSPSRESLSLTDTTINTICELLDHALSLLDYSDAHVIAPILDELYRKTFDWYFSKMDFMKLFTENMPVQKYAARKNITVPTQITNQKDFLLHWFRHQEKLSDFQVREQNIRVANALYNSESYRSHFLKKFLASNKKVWSRFDFQKILFKPLIRQIYKEGGMNPKNMLYYMPAFRKGEKGSFHHILNAHPTLKHQLAFLRPVVVLTYSRRAFEEDFGFLKSKITKKSEHPTLVYVVPRSKGGLDTAKAFFQKMGFIIENLTAETEVNKADYNKKVISRVPAPTGLISLKSLIGEYGRFECARHLPSRNENPIRIQNYTHVVLPHDLKSRWGKKFFPWGDDVGSSVVHRYGNRIGICLNFIQYQNQIKKGKQDGFTLIVNDLLQEMLTNQRIRNYFATTDTYTHRELTVTKLLSLGSRSDNIRKALNLPESIIEEDRITIRLIRDVLMSMSRYTHSDWEKLAQRIQNEVDNLKNNNPHTKIIEKLKNSKTAKLLDFDKMLHAIEHAKKEKDYSTVAFIEMSVITALK